MNKFNFLFILLFITMSTCSFGQFGGLIKKIKKPKTSVKKPTANNITKPSIENNRNDDGSPKHDSESPIYKAYSKAKEGLMFSKGAVEGFEAKQDPEKARADATKYLAKTKEHLDLLNGESSEQNREYLAAFNTEYKRLEDKHTNKSKESDQIKYHEDRLKEYQAWIVSGIELKSADLEPTVGGYKKTRDAFKNAHPDAFEGGDVKYIIKDVEEFFNTKVYQKVDWLEEDVDRTIKEMYEMHLDREQYILGADHYLKDFEQPLKDLAFYKENLLEDFTSANALEAKINKETTMLGEYISSGKFAANVAKFEQEIIDSRFLRKGMSDSKIESFAKSKLDSKYGKVLRVTIVSTGWNVSKNAFDIPTSKGMNVDLAVKQDDGKCYYIKGHVSRPYEGGGNYGDLFFNIYNFEGEMNCDNVTKNR